MVLATLWYLLTMNHAKTTKYARKMALALLAFVQGYGGNEPFSVDGLVFNGRSFNYLEITIGFLDFETEELHLNVNGSFSCPLMRDVLTQFGHFLVTSFDGWKVVYHD